VLGVELEFAFLRAVLRLLMKCGERRESFLGEKIRNVDVRDMLDEA